MNRIPSISDSRHPEEVRLYHDLAILYDEIMHGVDYEDWTDYIDTLIQLHHPGAVDILEIACGTGTMALELERFGDYRITATDRSPEMIRIARQKARQRQSQVTWDVQDMRTLSFDQPFDIVFMVFDSLNYLHEPSDIQRLFSSVHHQLKTDGRFLFDFTTPNFSPRIAPELNEKRKIRDGYEYTRESRYDDLEKIHINHFHVLKRNTMTGHIVQRFEEVHRQRIWSYDEMLEMASRSPLHMEAAYEDFDFSDASSNSDRITMVLRK
ncbi:class I SAM-dependent methyltransferase [Balneolaceae bacterium ANBcel3]|nr:class I SAM-dependent methyltransferase [Balneolaceae bacterium ANBcel3]